MRSFVAVLAFVGVVAYAAESARDQEYGIIQDIKPVTSDIAAVCEEWTQSRAKACEYYTDQLQQQYPSIANSPFPLLEEMSQKQFKYRPAFSSTSPKQGEQLFVCEKRTVQDPYRLDGVDYISVEEPKEKTLAPDPVKLPEGNQKPPVKQRGTPMPSVQDDQQYVLLADGKSDVQGKKGCMLDRDVQKKYTAPCARPQGMSGTKEDPKTCLKGLTILKGVPFSDESLQSFKQKLQCFKEEKGDVQKNKRTNVAEHISLASYTFCSDDADTLKAETEKDRQKKGSKPDSDTVEKKDLGAFEHGDGKAAEPRDLLSIKGRVSALMLEAKDDPNNAATLKSIFDESKLFGKEFLVEATTREVRERIKDYQEQLARGPESRAHKAALYGGLCGLGMTRYCKVTIRK